MKLLVYSHSFAPNIGGVETIVMLLARGLAELRVENKQQQFDVTLATETLAAGFDDGSLPFPVVRRPSLVALWRLIRAADVVHIQGPSLTPLLLAYLGRRPAVVEHHGYQAICPNGLLLHQPDGVICPGHFQAGRYGECVRCQAAEIIADVPAEFTSAECRLQYRGLPACLRASRATPLARCLSRNRGPVRE